MDWTVNDAIYHRFLKWKFKCKNILECELTALLECQKCKKVITWLGNFGMDQYVSWGLSKEEINLDSIWKRFEDFCMLQSNEVRAQFYLLTSFAKIIKVLMNDRMLSRQSKSHNVFPQNSKNFTLRHFLVLLT